MFKFGLQKEQAVDSAKSLPAFNVHKIYNKPHMCDASHIFMIFYYSFMI
ncbi:hypothetical protein CSU32_06445 [Salmonella enterica subsp. diarizonae]|nr:hypothetical protein [Salmonella enterica subsp. diarizonae]ECI3361275.1 hypothetical protein [Salmonella enterica subsp. diarizonae]